jgi:hypothetical protein
MQFNAVVFGLMMIAALMLPVPKDQLPFIVAAIVILSAPVSAVLSWTLAPRLRARFWRSKNRRTRAVWR